MPLLRIVIVGLATSLCWGCLQERLEGVVASVGERLITTADLEAGARRIFGEEKVGESLSADQKAKVLEALIAAELLDLEGAKLGLDQDPGIQRELGELERRLLVAEYYERELGTSQEVTEEEVQALYEEWGAGEQVHLAHILCGKREEAEQVLAELRQGRDFAELARQYSQHANSAPVGGDMGFLRKGLVFPEIVAAVWELPAGEVYPQPIHTHLGYHVVRVLGWRRLSLDEQKVSLRQRLEGEKRQGKSGVLWDKLQQQYQVQWNPEVARAMAAREELPEEQVLFSWQGGRLKAADYVRRAGVPQPVFSDSGRIHRLAESLVMEELASQEALKRGYGEAERVRRGLKEKRQELVRQKLYERVCVLPEIPEQQLRDFYEGHRERYRDHPRVAIREILVEDQTLADSLYRSIQAGASMEELARRFTQRLSLRESGGRWDEVSPGDPRSARIYQEALQGEGLLPPFKVPGGYSVIQVLGKQEGRSLDFAEVQNAVRDDFSTLKMDAFIDSLRHQYKKMIKVREL